MENTKSGLMETMFKAEEIKFVRVMSQHQMEERWREYTHAV